MEEYPVPEDVLFGEYFRVLPVVLSCKTTVLMPNSLAYEIVLTENDSIKKDEEINLAEIQRNERRKKSADHHNDCVAGADFNSGHRRLSDHQRVY